MHAPITLIGWAQTTQRKDAAPPWQTPLDLMADAAVECERLIRLGDR